MMFIKVMHFLNGNDEISLVAPGVSHDDNRYVIVCVRYRDRIGHAIHLTFNNQDL